MSDDKPKPTRFEPPASEAGQPFWDASRNQRFTLPYCTECGAPHWYPREVCPSCHADTIEWREASGTGTVYAVSVQHKPANPMMADRVPYAVALVELAEGPRMMSNVVGVPADEVAVGQSVAVAWEPMTDGRHLPVFELAKE